MPGGGAAERKFCVALEEHRRTPEGRLRTSKELGIELDPEEAGGGLFCTLVPISASLPMFEYTAREIADEMGRDRLPEAQDVARRARELAELFRSWGFENPPDEIRSQAIQKVIDLHREAQEYQASRR